MPRETVLKYKNVLKWTDTLTRPRNGINLHEQDPISLLTKKKKDTLEHAYIFMYMIFQIIVRLVYLPIYVIKRGLPNHLNPFKYLHTFII